MGYGAAPWIFKGQALYQLSLVRVEEAKKYVPAELPLVNFFGWTLGGFYLARYTDSPVGAFDELVALAGLAWNFPTSCAWAARVYVNNKDARNHGISSVGLPSRLAAFKAVPAAPLRGGSSANKAHSWWDIGIPGGMQAVKNAATPTASMQLTNSEPHTRGRGLRDPICCLEMPVPPSTWAPRIQMKLPSFSGATPDFPGLIKYSLRLMTHVRFLRPVGVELPAARHGKDRGSHEALDAVLGGRPLLCMAFENMEMEVQPPEVWEPRGRPLSVQRMQAKTA